MAELHSTARFSDRVDDYVRYRPDYPLALLEWLQRERLMSSSYAPKAGHPRHEPMLQALRELFDSCAENGAVSFDYDTRTFAGHLA